MDSDPGRPAIVSGGLSRWELELLKSILSEVWSPEFQPAGVPLVLSCSAGTVESRSLATSGGSRSTSGGPVSPLGVRDVTESHGGAAFSSSGSDTVESRSLARSGPGSSRSTSGGSVSPQGGRDVMQPSAGLAFTPGGAPVESTADGLKPSVPHGPVSPSGSRDVIHTPTSSAFASSGGGVELRSVATSGTGSCPAWPPHRSGSAIGWPAVEASELESEDEASGFELPECGLGKTSWFTFLFGVQMSSLVMTEASASTGPRSRVISVLA
jgi:hypothetical protein